MKGQRILHIVFLLVLVMVLSGGCGQSSTQTPGTGENPEQTKTEIKEVNISFDFTRTSTMASNQVAVWIEDANGSAVKTLFVTNFTAARRGYRNRAESLPSWVKASNPEEMSNSEIDAISSATFTTGPQYFSWDMTDADGNIVPGGTYKIMVEGTLFWGSTVLYSAELDTGNAVGGELTIKETRSEPNNRDNENMLQNVRVSVVMKENS